MEKHMSRDIDTETTSHYVMNETFWSELNEVKVS